MTEATPTPAEPVVPQLAIQKIYVKDLSFEAPNTPQVFTEQGQPQVDTQLGNQATTLGPGVHEVVLSVTVTVRFGDRTIYLAEVRQAGIFNIVGIADAQLAGALATVCPQILFPYARESVSDLITRGGFPPLYLPPVNFDALYAQEMARRQAAAEGGAGQPALN